jgi:hypothetical protein
MTNPVLPAATDTQLAHVKGTAVAQAVLDFQKDPQGWLFERRCPAPVAGASRPDLQEKARNLQGRSRGGPAWRGAWTPPGNSWPFPGGRGFLSRPTSARAGRAWRRGDLRRLRVRFVVARVMFWLRTCTVGRRVQASAGTKHFVRTPPRTGPGRRAPGARGHDVVSTGCVDRVRSMTTIPQPTDVRAAQFRALQALGSTANPERQRPKEARRAGYELRQHGRDKKGPSPAPTPADARRERAPKRVQRPTRPSPPSSPRSRRSP